MPKDGNRKILLDLSDVAAATWARLQLANLFIAKGTMATLKGRGSQGDVQRQIRAR